MASSSNSSSALVTSSKKIYYDVFVTFRGEDTRNNFIDFLFDALETKGICVFRDDINLEKGESIGPELLRSIERSQVYVAVFSRNYASSTWCLQELEKIYESVQGSEKHILPVFYDVDPSEVRKQGEIYCEAFVKHEQKFQQDFEMVSRWREALKQVGSISGWDLRDKPQAGEIKKIVQRIINILQCKSSCVSKDLVGLDSPIEALKNHLLLDSVDDVRVTGVCGMGGIGKTTLVMDLYDQICHQFSASCFIDDVTKIYRLHDGPLDAQKQILFQTLGIEHHQICNRYSATDLIRHRLRREKALLILDNVDQVEQLEKIAVHREWLGAGSRIIIISRDEHVLKAYGVDVVYKVPLLDWNEAHVLFCRKAFKDEKIIMSNYRTLSDEILNYAKGLPLALTVMGSFLFGRNVTEWKSALASLRENSDNDVMDVLQLSFDGLKHMEKEIFLHIACFFNSHSVTHVKNILNCCGFHADIGLRVLIDKSLISINYSLIKMHPLLKELGRKIVQENSSKEQRRWSRVWSKKQLYNVMNEKMEKHVEAIMLNYKYSDDKEVDVEHFSKMSNLRLLIIMHSGHISGTPSKWSLSNELRYVEWRGYPSKYLPSNFHPNELVELILAGSSITHLWENKKYLPNLRRLDLSHSRNLEKIIDFREFLNLERLNLEGCINLVELDPSIGLLRKLVYLNLDCCYNLVSIPNSIFGLTSLEGLNMRGCVKAFNNSRHSTKLGISKSAPRVRTTSSVFRHFMLPHHLSFLAPTIHTYMFPSLRSLCCLRKVDISFCHLSQVPDTIECLHWLERLNLGGNDFVTLPSLGKLCKLEYLNLEHCKLLESLPQLPFSTAIGRDHHKNKKDWRVGLVIFNCLKLGERERCCSMTFSWMMQYIQANPPSDFAGIQIVTPGSEIPTWINNQSMGDSIQIDESPIMHDSIGFVFCSVFSVAPRYRLLGWQRAWVKVIGRRIPVIIRGSLITTKSSHVWIMYLPRESYCEFGKIHFKVCGDEHFGIEVKSCGYRWVCKQDLQEFNLTTMNHEKSFAQKCKIFAIEDETQPQPQPEQESFISQVITTSQRRKSTSDNKSTAKTISVVNRKQRNKSRTSISATETEVSVEVPDSPVADEVSGESPSNKVGTSKGSSLLSDANNGSLKSKYSRPARKSEMPPVKNKDLVPGAAFTGKVKSIQPFGAFVDFGAFTNGLVHILMLSDSYVKDVASVVSVGQEVTVKVIEVNAETKRISLSMLENADTGKCNDAPNNTENAGPGRRDSSKSGPRKDKKNTKFVVGQELQGGVKNMTRSGTLISLPEGEVGLLPLAEEDDDGFGNIMGKSSLEIGQEVSVRVLHITRGQATLTMKKEGACSLLGPSTTVADDESNQGSIINGATEKETEMAAESLAVEGVFYDVNSIIEEAFQTDITTSNVETDSPVEVDDESVTENGVDQIVAEDEQQSQIDNGKEDVSAATQTDSDAVDPGPVITESEDDNVEAVPENNEIDASLAGQGDDLSPEGSVNKDVIEEVQQEQTPVAAQVDEVAIESETNNISNSNGQTEGPSEGFNFSRPMIILFLSLPVLKLLGMWVRR